MFKKLVLATMVCAIPLSAHAGAKKEFREEKEACVKQFPIQVGNMIPLSNCVDAAMYHLVQKNSISVITGRQIYMPAQMARDMATMQDYVAAQIDSGRVPLNVGLSFYEKKKLEIETFYKEREKEENAERTAASLRAMANNMQRNEMLDIQRQRNYMEERQLQINNSPVTCNGNVFGNNFSETCRH